MKEIDFVSDSQLFRACAEIDLEAIRHNLINISQGLPKRAATIAVVKAQAYGHGAVPVSKAIEDLVSAFAVAVFTEGEELRLGGISKPIYILGYSHPASFESVIRNKMIPAIYKLDDAIALSNAAKSLGMRVAVNIKVDTGMRRIGFEASESGVEAVKRISMLDNVDINGIFTHYSTADEEENGFADHQHSVFEKFLKGCAEQGVTFEHISCNNTAAALRMPYSAYTDVRIGIGLYGYYPSPLMKKSVELLPAMTIKSHIVSVKEIGKGEGVGYGRTFLTKRPTRVATVPVGYADGYPRALSNKGYVLVNGQRANIIGNVCMDMFMIDVTDVDAVDGDEVVLMGKGVDADVIADLCSTISYEIICGIGIRVKRSYK